MATAKQLLAELNRIGVHFVVGEQTPQSIPPMAPGELMAGLTAHKDARLRIALIAVLLQLPGYAADAEAALNLLTESDKTAFKLYYTAARNLQLIYFQQLEALGGSVQAIPDFFSDELDIPKEKPYQDQLRILADRHRDYTKLPLNWYGAYKHSAQRVLARMQKEREWAKV